jgi:hypothetical protein
MNSTGSGIILIVFGLLAMIGAALNWRFISRSRKLVNLLFGETIARIIYFVAGVLLFIVGIERLIGANWFKL